MKKSKNKNQSRGKSYFHLSNSVSDDENGAEILKSSHDQPISNQQVHSYLLLKAGRWDNWNFTQLFKTSQVTFNKSFKHLFGESFPTGLNVYAWLYKHCL